MSGCLRDPPPDTTRPHQTRQFITHHYINPTQEDSQQLSTSNQAVSTFSKPSTMDKDMKDRLDKAKKNDEGAKKAEEQKNKESWGKKAKDMGESAKKHINPLGGNPPDKGGK
ncbi:MAG: hypothetical protein Q9159_002893 [Coniocarpon cinnabarinum]